MGDYCSLADAFPASLAAAPGCRGSSAAITQSKEERRRAKKCKGPQAAYLADPDRPSLATPLDDDQVMRGSGAVNPYNPETGLFENGPLGTDQIIGASVGSDARLPNGQAVDELIVKAPASAYTERKAPPSPASNTKLMETPGPARLYSSQQKPPAYFGAGVEDDGLGGGTNSAVLSKEEGYADYVPSAAASKDDFMLSPDFSKTFGARGVNRAAGAALPVPSIVDVWKKLTPAGAQSSFFETLPPPGGEYIIGGGGQQPDIRRKLDQIFARLDDLESDRSGSESNQMEIFLFILSGMMVMFSVDAFSRR
jgi:hypothetical protein